MIRPWHPSPRPPKIHPRHLPRRPFYTAPRTRPLEAHLPARGNLEFGKTCFVGEHHCASIRAESKALSIQRTIPRSDGSLQEYAAFGDVPDSQTILYDRAKGRSVGADGYRTWTSKSHLRQPGSQIQR